jgi:1,4-alpha-glucan branching enzyme
LFAHDGAGHPHDLHGQDFLEDKQWSDNPNEFPGHLIWWQGLDDGRDPEMVNFHRFMEQLIWLRRNQPALRSGLLNVFHCHDANRVLASHRWIESWGRDVVVVASLNDWTFNSYDLPWPSGGHWQEIFNSDAYGGYEATGNYGGVDGWWGSETGCRLAPASCYPLIRYWFSHAEGFEPPKGGSCAIQARGMEPGRNACRALG